MAVVFAISRARCSQRVLRILSSKVDIPKSRKILNKPSGVVSEFPLLCEAEEDSSCERRSGPMPGGAWTSNDPRTERRQTTGSYTSLITSR